MKQDQMSMAASIESRVPFLDHTLVEFAARLPDESEALGLDDQAHPARGDAAIVLPASILKRPKMGFPVPFGALDAAAAGTPSSRDVLLDRRRASAASSSPPPSSGCSTTTPPVPSTAAMRIWSLLNLELWYPHVHRRRRRPDAAVPARPRWNGSPVRRPPCASSG